MSGKQSITRAYIVLHVVGLLILALWFNQPVVWVLAISAFMIAIGIELHRFSRYASNESGSPNQVDGYFPNIAWIAISKRIG